jgi:MFS family permease
MSTPEEKPATKKSISFGNLLRRRNGRDDDSDGPAWSSSSLGILSDKQTAEVPGTVQLLASKRNRPLGMRSVPTRTSHSTIPVGFPENVPQHHGRSTSRPASQRRGSSRASSIYREPQEEAEEKKKTPDGNIILEPQPDDSANDPLNWKSWRRDVALLSLGFYCMVGGGTTPILAAGFTNVAEDYNVGVETVALTTGLYMMGMGLGSVIASPIAILYGKRPVYLASAILFIVTSLWSGLSPSFSSLLAARVFQGVAVSPVECLPSATIAEIFFLHERAYRIGIYTLLLLGGKNLVPLVSAAIIGGLGWRWVFYIIAMIIAFSGGLLFLFVPETFWDRTPTRARSRAPSLIRRISWRPSMSRRASSNSCGVAHQDPDQHAEATSAIPASGLEDETPVEADITDEKKLETATAGASGQGPHHHHHVGFKEPEDAFKKDPVDNSPSTESAGSMQDVTLGDRENPAAAGGVFSNQLDAETGSSQYTGEAQPATTGGLKNLSLPGSDATKKSQIYTQDLRQRPPKTFVQQLKPYHGRLNDDEFFKVMVRPFVLFTYPAVLWSSVIYSCSVGWLIVISETMAIIYRNPESYNFTALQTGLVYISPFVGGILGTGVAGYVSDIIVRAMSRRNGGVYEPEFRLVMALPVLITTCIGLMGFGWSAEERDHWMVPTFFFGCVSFGCSLGSTTAITFVVDSYRQYAGEALVTLNFSKNIFHGLVFSLFVGHWLHGDGPKMVFIWIGVIQLILLLLTIPMYIYGKRARMWTVRKNLMEKF